MVEIALFDVDGVVIVKREKFFSARLTEEFGVDKSLVDDFVENALKPAMVDSVDMREVFPSYLSKWGINKTVDEMFNIWWSAESQVQIEVLDLIDKIRLSGIKTFLVTDQERHRAKFILNNLGLGEHFDGAFISYQLKSRKKDQQFWQKILAELKAISPNRMMYWDDDIENVEQAREFGIQGNLFTDILSFKKELNLINESQN